ncbi:MAG: outer membrane beta-barrel protein [Hyphomicrobiaceae bacterium]
MLMKNHSIRGVLQILPDPRRCVCALWIHSRPWRRDDAHSRWRLALAAAGMIWTGSAQANSQSCGSGPFAGLYIGASASYSSLDAEQSPAGEAKVSGDDDSFGAGGHVGYNFQCGRIVFGVEGDLNYAGLSARSSQTGVANPAYFRSEVDWYGTLRGRLGVMAAHNMMIYGTAGIAWADRSHWLSNPGAPGGQFEQTDSDTAHGFVIGGGVELLRDERWTIRAEVLHVDLGQENHEYVVSTTGCGGGVCRANVGWDDTFWTARLGVSIKLGRSEPHYEPLK